MKGIVAAIAFLSAVLSLATPPAPARASPAAAVAIASSVRSGDQHIYRLTVAPGSAPVMVVVPYDARIATLEVDGVERERVGRDIPVGTAPLGRGAATFTLEGLGPRDRVVVRVTGSEAPLRFVYDVADVREANFIGFAGGIVIAILATVAIFQLLAVFALRDPTIAWYLGFTLSLIGIELARDSYLPFGQTGNVAGLLVFSALSTFCIVGFSASYLRLRTQAPKLLYAAIFWGAIPSFLGGVFIVATNRRIDILSLAVPDLACLVALIVIAAVRRRSGYEPATYLGLGLVGITLIFAAKIVRDVAGLPSPFLDRWGLEIGAVFDVFAFSQGVAFRYKYLVAERERMTKDLNAATHAAQHDQLTGLLNRRGLETRFRELAPAESAVLFVDLDGFKAVNDAGGHAAGDRALRGVARILSHAVRAADLVARVGGDEFVVVLLDASEIAGAPDVIARITSAVSFFRPLGADNDTRIGVSIGCAATNALTSLSAALETADADAYRIKAEHYGAARSVKRRLEGRLQA